MTSGEAELALFGGNDFERVGIFLFVFLRRLLIVDFEGQKQQLREMPQEIQRNRLIIREQLVVIGFSKELNSISRTQRQCLLWNCFEKLIYLFRNWIIQGQRKSISRF